jgi:hypothetical protein
VAKDERSATAAIGFLIRSCCTPTGLDGEIADKNAATQRKSQTLLCGKELDELPHLVI